MNIKNTVQKVSGLKCFKSGYVYGSMFIFDLGYPEVTFDRFGGSMSVCGEWSVTAEMTAWIILHNGKLVARSDNPRMRMRAGISLLSGQTIEKIDFNEKTFDIKFHFSHGLILEFDSNKWNLKEENPLWNLKTPNSIITFYKNGKHIEEKEPKGIKKLTIQR